MSRMVHMDFVQVETAFKVGLLFGCIALSGDQILQLSWDTKSGEVKGK